MGVMLTVLACMLVIPVAAVALVILLVVYGRRWSAWKRASSQATDVTAKGAR